MKILLVDFRKRGENLEERIKKVKGIDLLYKKEVFDNPKINKHKSYIEIPENEKINTQEFGIIFIHGSREQMHSGKFIVANIQKPMVVYGGGDLTEFKNSCLQDSKPEHNNLHFFNKTLESGNETDIKIEKFLEQWIKYNKMPEFQILYGWSDQIKKNVFKINTLFLPLIIDIKGLTEVYIADNNEVTNRLIQYLQEVCEGRQKYYFRLKLLEILYIISDIEEIEEIQLPVDIKEKIALNISVLSIIRESNLKGKDKIMGNLNNLMEVDTTGKPYKGNLYKFFEQFDSILNKQSLKQEDIRRLFKLDGKIKTSVDNANRGIVGWYQVLISLLSNMATNIDSQHDE